MGPGRQGTRGRAGVRLSGDGRAVRSVGADRWACGSGADGPLRDAGEREQAGVSWAEGEEVGRLLVGSGREKWAVGVLGPGLVGLLGLDSFSNFLSYF